MKSIGRLSFTLLALIAISIIAPTTAASANEGGSVQVVSIWPKSAQPVRCSSSFGSCRPIVQCGSYTIDSYLMGSGGFFSPRRKLQPLITLMRYEDRGDNHACVHNLTGMPEGQEINIRITPKNWVYPSGVSGRQMMFQDATTTLYRSHPDRPASGIVPITGGLIALPR